MPSLTAKSAAIRRLTVHEAIDYFRQAHGVKVTSSALAQHRFAGTGPDYCLILRRVYYSPADIDHWIAKKVADWMNCPVMEVGNIPASWWFRAMTAMWAENKAEAELARRQEQKMKQLPTRR